MSYCHRAPPRSGLTGTTASSVRLLTDPVDWAITRGRVSARMTLVVFMTRRHATRAMPTCMRTLLILAIAYHVMAIQPAPGAVNASVWRASHRPAAARSVVSAQPIRTRMSSGTKHAHPAEIFPCPRPTVSRPARVSARRDTRKISKATAIHVQPGRLKT